MKDLCKEFNSLEERGNFEKTIKHVQAAIDFLTKAKENVSNDPSNAAITLAGLKKPVKDSFHQAAEDFKEVYHAQAKYSKAIDRVSWSRGILHKT